MTSRKTRHDAPVAFESCRSQIMGFSFQDNLEFVHGCTLSMRVSNVLYQGATQFQQIAVFQTERLGRVLVLDGTTMLTEFDEFSYHEMITHVPLLVHPKPSRVLIIGGGDGGVVREALKHPEVKSVHLCEIDKGVVDVCRQYLPSLASSLDDPRVEIFYEDGARFVMNRPKSYEVIIVDSTDPVGPGQILFQREFYVSMKEALTDEGIVVSQCESIFLHRNVVERVYQFARELFPKSNYYYTLVPTYPSGMIGFYLGSLKRDPLKEFDERRARRLKGLRYYSPELHPAAFALPRFAVEYFGRK